MLMGPFQSLKSTKTLHICVFWHNPHRRQRHDLAIKEITPVLLDCRTSVAGKRPSWIYSGDGSFANGPRPKATGSSCIFSMLLSGAFFDSSCCRMAEWIFCIVAYQSLRLFTVLYLEIVGQPWTALYLTFYQSMGLSSSLSGSAGALVV